MKPENGAGFVLIASTSRSAQTTPDKRNSNLHKLTKRNSIIVVGWSLLTQKHHIGRGYVITNSSKNKCYEMTEVLQCNACFRYGHMRKNCSFQKRCSICAANCALDAPNQKCSNCSKSKMAPNTKPELFINQSPSERWPMLHSHRTNQCAKKCMAEQ